MGLPTILADELDANIDLVGTEFALPDPRYIDPDLGEQQRREHVVAQQLAAFEEGRSRCTRDARRCRGEAMGGRSFGMYRTRRLRYHTSSNRSATYGSVAVAASALPVRPTWRSSLRTVSH